MERLIVVVAYIVVLAVISFPPASLRDERNDRAPWWRNVRVWATLVVVVQIAVYLRWG